jgi:hypothetical protein
MHESFKSLSALVATVVGVAFVGAVICEDAAPDLHRSPALTSRETIADLAHREPDAPRSEMPIEAVVAPVWSVTARVEWTLMMGSCWLNFRSDHGHRGYLAIRPDVSPGSEPNGWQRALAPLDEWRNQDVSVDLLRSILPQVSDLSWDSPRVDPFLKRLELTGHGGGLRFSFGVETDAGELVQFRDSALRQT